MIAHHRRRFTAMSRDRAAAALAAYRSHPGRPAPLGALYGYRQVMNRRRRLVDGPACLVVLTPETITLSAARTGAILAERALADLDGCLVDPHGRFVMRFQDAGDQAHVGTFRPVAAPNTALSASAASALFVRRVIAVWELRTGRPFTNTWTGRTAAATT